MEFFYVVKATQKSGKQDAVIWFTAKSEARAALTLDVELEDAGIETGRGKDYTKPIRTDFPVYNDLPEEGDVDFTWCDRYELPKTSAPGMLNNRLKMSLSTTQILKTAPQKNLSSQSSRT